MKRKILALGVGVVLMVAAGCSSRTHHPSAPTTSPLPASTTTTTTDAAPNPDVIPSVITPAYVNAVFAVLNHVYGNATRELVAAKAVTPAVKANLRAIFGDSLYAEQVQAAEKSLQGVISNVRPNAGDRVTLVRSLIAASQDCIFVETSSDLAAVLIQPTPNAASEYYELTRKPEVDDPEGLNPTPWILTANLDYTTPTVVKSQCDG